MVVQGKRSLVEDPWFLSRGVYNKVIHSQGYIYINKYKVWEGCDALQTSFLLDHTNKIILKNCWV